MPDDPLLAEVGRALEEEDHTGEVLDSDWRIRYISAELRHMTGVYDDSGLGYGLPSLSRMHSRPEAWRATPESGAAWLLKEAPYYLHDRERGSRGDAWLDENIAKAPELAADRAAAGLGLRIRNRLPSGQQITVSRVAIRPPAQRRVAGRHGRDLRRRRPRASVQTMLTRGDPGMFERMTALVEPGRRPAAVLFADLAASGVSRGESRPAPTSI